MRRTGRRLGDSDKTERKLIVVMHMQMELSFVIPVYNKSERLAECMDSVLAVERAFPGMVETVLVDDASSDGSDALCRQYQAENESVACICLEKNVGPGEARNCGLQAARGRFVFFQDADDVISVERMNECVRSLLERPETDVLCFAPQLSNVADLSDMPQNVPTDRLLSRSGGILITSLWNYIMRRDFLKSRDIAFPATRICEDYAFVTQALIWSEYCRLYPHACYVYRKYAPTSTAMTSAFDKKYAGSMEYLRTVDSLLKEQLSDEKRTALEQARREMETLILTIPGAADDKLLMRQRALEKRLAEMAHDAKREIYLCPACDMSLELARIFSAAGHIRIKGFLDNHAEKSNPNAAGLRALGYCVKSMADANAQSDCVCICHRSYLTAILKKQLCKQGFIKGNDFCCLSDF